MKVLVHLRVARSFHPPARMYGVCHVPHVFCMLSVYLRTLHTCVHAGIVSHVSVDDRLKIHSITTCRRPKTEHFGGF